MFYSGWKFPTPQRIVSSGSPQDASYFVQETCSPGISLIHFLSPGAQHGTSGSMSTQQKETGERIHLKSDVPIHPHSGVFYFEVEIRSVTAPTRSNNSNNSVEPTEPGVVVGICRDSLSPHSLPGEEAPSIGLFTAQRMVYANGKSEGEVARFPSGSRKHTGSTYGPQDDHRTRGVKAGDIVGCIVNLIDGSVRFTFNGEVLSVVSPLLRKFPKHGYYPAIGLFRLVPSVCLRVAFQPSGRLTSVPRPHLTAPDSDAATTFLHEISSSSPQDRLTATAGYFVFDLNKYCEGIAEELMRLHQRKAAETTAEEEETSSCRCRDANIIAAIRRHFMARGMTRVLSAFEKEQEELQRSALFQAGWPMHATEESHAASSCNVLPKVSKNSNCGSGRNPYPGSKDKTAVDAQNMAYTLKIQKLREDISRGDMLSTTQCILSSGVISPLIRDKLTAVVEGADALPPDFWGIAFFAQRCDILFLLRAVHVVEVAFNTVEEGLGELLTSVRETGGQRDLSQFPTNTNTTTRFMEMALDFLLKPFEEVSAAVRQHQRFSAPGVRTVDEAAFGVLNDSLGKDESKCPSDDFVAHLFFLGKETLWSGPEVPITLLLRRSVPSVPPPRPRKQQSIVQTLSALVSHQRAVCARMQEERLSNATCELVEGWLRLLEDVRAQYRARCWCLLLHAIEDFNGGLEYRLHVWLRKHESELQKAKNGTSSCQRIFVDHHHDDGKKCLFPSLRAAWRHVHAAAALEPLFHVVTKAFSEKLHSAAMDAQLATITAQSKKPPGFQGRLKRSLSFSYDVFESEVVDERGESGTLPDNTMATVSHATPSGSRKNVLGGAATCYSDDVRLSFLYMKRIYKSVFSQ